MAVRKTIPGQIENRNFLSPVGFNFQVNRAPTVSYFGNSINIPGMSLGIAEQPNYLTNIPLPGDKIDFQDLTLRFLIDEGLENYMEIQKWIRGIGFPESLSEIYDFQKDDDPIKQPERSQLNLYSDGTLTILDSNHISKFKIVFENLFPYSLGDIEFDATQTDIEYLTAEVIFKYSMYNITEIHHICD